MALQLYRFPLPSSSSSHSHFLYNQPQYHLALRKRKLGNFCLHYHKSNSSWRRKKTGLLVGKEDLELRVQNGEEEFAEEEEEEDVAPPSPQDLEYIQEIKRVLELLKKNRDMLFNEVKLTIMIEDPREIERRQLLGIDSPDDPTRDDLVEALVQVNEGKVPKNRVALKMLAEEMANWPNLEVEAPKTKPKKSLYAKATDTGIDPKEAAKRLKIDWDSAADIEDVEDSNETEVPAAVGYGALYLVSAFPVIIDFCFDAKHINHCSPIRTCEGPYFKSRLGENGYQGWLNMVKMSSFMKVGSHLNKL